MNKNPVLKTEALAGFTTFVTLSYIVVVNPSILSTQGTGMPFQGVLTATVTLAILMTLLMGLYARLPFAVAPGMGINAFFTFALVLGKQIPWTTALGLVFWSGVLFVVLSLLPVRSRIARAFPESLQQASAVGIGIFLTFIGLKNAGLITSDPVTFVKLGIVDTKVMLSLLGLVVVIVLVRRQSPFAFLLGIVFVTLAALAKGFITPPAQVFSLPDFKSTFFRLDIFDSLKPQYLAAIFVLCFTDFFDSVATFIGVALATGLTDDKGQPKNLRQGMLVDALATLTAGLFGTSPGTAYIESAAGIEAGGRTGMTSVFTALALTPCLFIAPLVAIIPAYATAPVLIVIGALMFRNVSKLTLTKVEDLIPAYLTIVLIPLTFSITQGMLWGLISYVVLHVLAGRRNELDPVLYAIAAASIGLLWLER